MRERMARPLPTWYMLVAIFASTFLVSVLGLVYTNWKITQAIAGSERRQCEEIKAEVDYYVHNPPDTDRLRDRQLFFQNRYEEICLTEEAPR